MAAKRLPASQTSVDSMLEDLDERELLHAAARDRWGERYTVRINEYATGERSMHAYQLRGQNEDGTRTKELLKVFVDEESYAVWRRVVEPEQFADGDELLEDGSLAELVADLAVAPDVDGDGRSSGSSSERA
jgi:hypothetical protein